MKWENNKYEYLEKGEEIKSKQIGDTRLRHITKLSESEKRNGHDGRDNNWTLEK